MSKPEYKAALSAEELQAVIRRICHAYSPHATASVLVATGNDEPRRVAILFYPHGDPVDCSLVNGSTWAEALTAFERFIVGAKT